MAMVPATRPSTKEQGVVASNLGGSGILSWGQLIDDMEFAPELRFPASIWVWDRVSSTDAQVKGLMAGTILPIERFRYTLDPSGASDEAVQKLSSEIKVPIKGKEDEFMLGRTRNRFTWRRHAHDALKALKYGFYDFEQVMENDEDKYGDDFYHIRKIAPRPPFTISDILTDPDGGLKEIKQWGRMGIGAQGKSGIKVNALLHYVWDMEGANWYGRSMLRSVFRNYIIKDMLMRIDARKHERTGMGVPWFEAPEGASQELIDQLDELAQDFRGGDESGGAGPHGARLRLVGVEGSTPDTVASIRLHNEEMARSFLMMFMQLGQTDSGSRALGESFIDFFSYAQESIADWLVETFNEHMIEDWIDWNYGEDEAAPRLVYTRSNHEDPSTADLALLVEKGMVQVDPELESFIRKSRNLPVRSEGTPPPPAQPPAPVPPQPAPAQAGSGRRGSGPVTAGPDDAPSPVSLPDRSLRRQPYEHEVTASTDFARLDNEYTERRDKLFDEVKGLQASQVDELHDLIVEAEGDIVKLSSLTITDTTHEAILASMQDMADEGIAQAATEAEAQGVKSVTRPNLSDLEDSITNRAQGVGNILTRELSSAAANRAIKLTSPVADPKEVAAATREYLNGLVKERVQAQLGGAMNTAMNSGRKITMKRNNAKSIYSSELLDTSTCKACMGEDGKEFDTVEEAESDYPGGGYAFCEGGDRCRGTLVAIYGEEAPAL